MDIIDIYNADKIPVGHTNECLASFGEKQYRLVIHVCIFNSRNELLIQKRCDTCHKWPGKWDVTVSGCAISGEAGRDAAMREVKEELSIDIDLQNARPAFSVSFPNGFDELFILKQDVDLSAVVLQKEEVSDVRWANEDEILSMIDSGTFTPFIPDYIRTLFRYKDIGDIFNPVI